MGRFNTKYEGYGKKVLERHFRFNHVDGRDTVVGLLKANDPSEDSPAASMAVAKAKQMFRPFHGLLRVFDFAFNAVERVITVSRYFL